MVQTDKVTENQVAAEPLLNVTESFSGRIWNTRPADLHVVAGLSQRLGISEVLARVIVGRGISRDEAETYLSPSLRALMPNPSIFKDMDKAAKRVAEAIKANEVVAVFGDYDVDGATSSALLHRFFAAIGRDLVVHIPDRMTEGYGPNWPAFEKMRAEGAELIVTVDCGTLAYDVLAQAAAAGLDVIVADHHQAEPILPKAVAVVNPNRLDEDGQYGQMAAVGVVYMLVVAVNRQLRDEGWYSAQGIRPPDLLQWLDLVALGTVCDVVPLTGVNRAFVAQGLKVAAQRKNVGLKALADICGVTDKPSTYHAGFIYGPRVNAGGRVGRADAGVKLLTTNEVEDANNLAAELHHYNLERQAIEQQAVEEATAQFIRAHGIDGGTTPIVFVAGEGWHPGVVGIVAGRLKERFQRPTFVISIDEEGQGKGSARSIPGVDVGNAVISACQAGVLLNGGGHSMAAGLTVAAGQYEALESFLIEKLGTQVEAAKESMSLKLDGVITAGAAKLDLLDELAKAAPYGQGNGQPRFAIANMTLSYVDIVGQNHVRCQLRGADGTRLKAMAFRAAEQPLGQELLAAKGQRIHVAGVLRRNEWNGNVSVEMTLDDAAPA